MLKAGGILQYDFAEQRKARQCDARLARILFYSRLL